MTYIAKIKGIDGNLYVSAHLFHESIATSIEKFTRYHLEAFCAVIVCDCSD